MDERIGPALSIMRRSTDPFKSYVLIKPECPAVLLIYIGCQMRVVGERRLNKGLPCSFAVLVSVYKKRFKMALMQEHEALRSSGTINGERETHLRKQVRHLGFDDIPIVGG